MSVSTAAAFALGTAVAVGALWAVASALEDPGEDAYYAALDEEARAAAGDLWTDAEAERLTPSPAAGNFVEVQYDLRSLSDLTSDEKYLRRATLLNVYPERGLDYFL